MGALTAQAMYGGVPGAQPTPTPIPSPAGEPEATMATRKPSRAESPILALVVLLGLVVLLTQLSFRGTIRVSAG